MNTIKVDSFNVTGLVVRTSNAEEMNSSTAKIGALWEEFYKSTSSKLNENSCIYGLYTNYESDATGEFDMAACSDTLSPEALENFVKFQIPSGNYLKFSGKGEMPQAVINLWGEVWGTLIQQTVLMHALIQRILSFTKAMMKLKYQLQSNRVT